MERQHIDSGSGGKSQEKAEEKNENLCPVIIKQPTIYIYYTSVILFDNCTDWQTERSKMYINYASLLLVSDCALLLLEPKIKFPKFEQKCKNVISWGKWRKTCQ